MSDPFKRGAAIYVDVDDTLVRHASTKAVPIDHVVAQVRRLHARGFSLYCWSTGGADYARRVVTEIGLAECFSAFLPKPTILIDDQEMSVWLLKTFHPTALDDEAVDSYLP